MENFSPKHMSHAAPARGSVAYIPQVREAWPLMRAAHMDLQLLQIPRVNLLLVGPDRLVEGTLDLLTPAARTPIASWRATETLVLPPAGQTGTLILRGLDGLALEDQRRLVAWLELSTGRTQIISTATHRLLTHVQTGDFLDTLYYRLNTVCVDVSA